jgi:hypothetical protein
MADLVALVAAADANAALLARINERIEAVAHAEKITKVELGHLSREMVEYITINESPDVATLNRLLGVLSPMNYKTATLYFAEFVPHKWDEEGNVFGARIKGDKKIKEFQDKARLFLNNEDNNIWTWAAANLKVEKKPKDYLNKITKLVEKALEDEDEGADMEDVILAVFAGGVDVKAMLDVIATLNAPAPVAEAA